MAFGFPYPRFIESRTFDRQPEELFAAVKAALEKLGWSYHVLWGQDFEAWIPTTNWSWHHELKVRILPGGVIEAESKSAYQEMFFDFGRNRKNVETFLAQVEQITGRHSRDNA